MKKAVQIAAAVIVAAVLMFCEYRYIMEHLIITVDAPATVAEIEVFGRRDVYELSPVEYDN